MQQLNRLAPWLGPVLCTGMLACAELEPELVRPEKASPSRAQDAGAATKSSGATAAGAGQKPADRPSQADSEPSASDRDADDADAARAGARDAGASSSDSASVAPDQQGESCSVPSCLSDVFEACAPSGGCTLQAGTDGVGYCFDNGVTVRATLDGASTVFDADGDVCFQVEVSGDEASLVVTYYDEAGEALAGVTRDLESGRWTVSCIDQDDVVIDGEACGFEPTDVPGLGDVTACELGDCS